MRINNVTNPYYNKQKVPAFKGCDLTDLIKEQTLTLGDVSIYNRFNSKKSCFLSVKKKGDFLNKGIDVYDANDKTTIIKTLLPVTDEWCKYIAPDEVFYDISDLNDNDNTNTTYVFDINGLNFSFNPIKDNYQTRVFLNSKYNGGVTNVIKEGNAKGKFLNIIGQDIRSVEENIKEPVILYLDAGQAERLLTKHCPYIKGLIIQSIDTHLPQTAHVSSEFRAMSDVCIVTDPSKTIVSDSFEGKYIALKIGSNGNCIYKQISQDEVQEENINIPPAKVEVQKYDASNKDILLPKDCTPDVIGAKAVNLNRLKELSENGTLDVIIPPFIGLPFGYLVNMYASNPGKLQDFDKIKEPYLYRIPYMVCDKDEYCNGLMNELKKVLKANKINGDDVMVRSSFNVEDLPDINTAGIFDSTESSYKNNELFSRISHVASKIQSLVPAFSKRYNIPLDDIQPGVVLQKKIDADYRYTIYTDDGHGNLIMDLMQKNSDGYYYFWKNVIPSCKIIYNKAEKSIKIQPNLNNTMTKRNIKGKSGDTVSLSYMHEMNLYNTSVFQNTLKKVIRNALAVEKAFGCPQDIEGGFNINRFNSLLMRLKATCNMTNKAYMPKIKNVQTAEKIITVLATILSGLTFGSVASVIYGFFATSLACLTFNNIAYLKQAQRFHNLYSVFSPLGCLKNIVNNNNIYFWQTRNVVDLCSKIR